MPSFMTIATLVACISALSPAANLPPVASAGNDTTVQVGALFSLKGSATDETLPADSLHYAWTRISGPDTGITILHADWAKTAVRPSVTGVCAFVLAASDGALTDYDTVVITIAAAFVPKVLAPAAGARVVAGTTVTIRWEIETPSPVIVYYSLDNGLVWVRINEGPIAAGTTSYDWMVPDTLPASNSCLIAVHHYTTRILLVTSGIFFVDPAIGVERPALARRPAAPSGGIVATFAPNGRRIGPRAPASGGSYLTIRRGEAGTRGSLRLVY